jgi:hypothetical protein
MQAGVPKEDCLKEYPKFTNELRTLLSTVEVMKDLRVDNIPLEPMDQNQKKLLSLAESLRAEKKHGSRNTSFDWLINPFKQVFQSFRLLSPVAGRLILALCIAGIFIIFSGGLLTTSAKSLPGDSLYPVKRAVEDIKVYLAPSGELRHEYEDTYSQQRVDEVSQLMGLAREQQISFEGIITSMDKSNWNVSGIPVIVQSSSTIISGAGGIKDIVPGMRVEVEGNTSSQGLVYANEIHVREYQFVGTVEEINPNNWKISGTTLIISRNTQIDPRISVGDEVTVLIHSEDNGLFALAILGELYPNPTSTPVQPVQIPPTITEDSTIENADEYNLLGTLDQVDKNYWIVGGDIIYLVNDTQLEDGINPGDDISVSYKIEQNGSYTAVEIMRSDDSDKPNDVQETPEGTGEGDHGSNYSAPTEVNETEENTHPAMDEETPEPTEVHHSPN